jgi:hypothetical protein
MDLNKFILKEVPLNFSLDKALPPNNEIDFIFYRNLGCK